ncbi:hypothetical protein D9M68_428900 [compost metagenome]
MQAVPHAARHHGAAPAVQQHVGFGAAFAGQRQHRAAFQNAQHFFAARMALPHVAVDVGVAGNGLDADQPAFAVRQAAALADFAQGAVIAKRHEMIEPVEDRRYGMELCLHRVAFLGVMAGGRPPVWFSTGRAASA